MTTLKTTYRPLQIPFYLVEQLRIYYTFFKDKRLSLSKKMGSFTANEFEHAQTFVTKLKMIYCHYKSIFTWSSNSESTWCLQGQKVVSSQGIEMLHSYPQMNYRISSSRSILVASRCRQSRQLQRQFCK